MFENYRRINNPEQWVEFVRAGSLELALKFHGPMPKFPILGLRESASPDAGPGAADRLYWLTRKDAEALLARFK